MLSPIRISREKLLLADSSSTYWFCTRAYQAYGLKDVQAFNTESTRDKGLFLRHLKLLPHFSRVTTLVMACEAKPDAARAIDAAQSALAAGGFTVPGEPFIFSEGYPRTAFIVFPGWSRGEEEALADGTVEDLYLSTLAGDPVLTCVDRFLGLVQEEGECIGDISKARLHAFMAAKNGYTGLGIQEAARRGSWDWGHPAMRRIKAILVSM